MIYNQLMLYFVCVIMYNIYISKLKPVWYLWFRLSGQTGPIGINDILYDI